jgi:hypothetical protein
MWIIQYYIKYCFVEYIKMQQNKIFPALLLLEAEDNTKKEGNVDNT